MRGDLIKRQFLIATVCERVKHINGREEKYNSFIVRQEDEGIIDLLSGSFCQDAIAAAVFPQGFCNMEISLQIGLLQSLYSPNKY